MIGNITSKITNHDYIRIIPGGPVPWFLILLDIVVSIIFVKWLIERLANQPFSSFSSEFVYGTLICIFLTAIAFLYWRFNYIELKDGCLISCYWKRPSKYIKLIKIKIELANIERISVELGWICSDVLMIIEKGKPENELFIDTKPFSKKGIKRLIGELEKRGIAVDTSKCPI